MNMNARIISVVIAVIAGQNAALPALEIPEAYYQVSALGQRSLIIKPYPAIENFQSDLYEVYMEPYGYDLGGVMGVAVLQSEGESAVKGEIFFLQRHPPAGPVLIQGNFTGLPKGNHGLHIHQSGDLRQGCEKLGEHFNPYLLQHGGPADPLRHVGDLGNIETGDEEVTQVRLVDPIMSLVGPRSVVGRAIVVSTCADDLGRGGTADSITTGSSGNPLGCGVIAYVR